MTRISLFMISFLILAQEPSSVFCQFEKLKWEFKTDSWACSPAIGRDGRIYLGSGDSYLYSLQDDGTLNWKFKAGSKISSEPTIFENLILYFGCQDNFLYALDLDGNLKWKYRTNGEIFCSPAIGAKGEIYFGSWDRNFYALDSDGILIWKYKTEYLLSSSPAIGRDGTIYFGGEDNYFYALNKDGSLKWKFLTTDPINNSAAITEDGTIYFGSGDEYFYALTKGGSLKWKFPLYRTMYDVTVNTAGTIFVGTYEYYLCAFVGNSQLANTPWPKNRKDLENNASSFEYTIKDISILKEKLAVKLKTFKSEGLSTPFGEYVMEQIIEAEKSSDINAAIHIFEFANAKIDSLIEPLKDLKKIHLTIEQLECNDIQVPFLENLAKKNAILIKSGHLDQAEKVLSEANKSAEQVILVCRFILSAKKNIESANSLNANIDSAEAKLKLALEALGKGEFDSASALAGEASKLAKTASVGKITIADLIASADLISGRLVEVEGKIEDIKPVFGEGYMFKLVDSNETLNCRYTKTLKEIKNGDRVEIVGQFSYEKQLIRVDNM